MSALTIFKDSRYSRIRVWFFSQSALADLIRFLFGFFASIRLLSSGMQRSRGVLARLGPDADGVPDKNSLVIRGWQRAGSWSALFGAGLGGLDYPAPFVIYAATIGDLWSYWKFIMKRWRGG